MAQVCKGHKCAMSAEMAVWLRNCPCLYSYLHNWLSRQLNRNIFSCLLKVSSVTSLDRRYHSVRFHCCCCLGLDGRALVWTGTCGYAAIWYITLSTCGCCLRLDGRESLWASTECSCTLQCAGRLCGPLPHYFQGRRYVEARGGNCLLVMWPVILLVTWSHKRTKDVVVF